MSQYRVSLEIQITAESPLEAAKIAQSWIREDNWQYYTQNEDTKEVHSVDLNEEDDDAVLPVDNYKPFIEQ